MAIKLDADGFLPKTDKQAQQSSLTGGEGSLIPASPLAVLIESPCPEQRN